MNGPGQGEHHPASRRAPAIFAGLWLAAAAASATAHWLRPEDVTGELRAPEVTRAFDITDVRRDPSLPRLLVIRVGRNWATVSAARRRRAAEQWMAHWRQAVPQGIIAILDRATGVSLVGFDPQGRATLRDGASGRTRAAATESTHAQAPGP